MDSKCVSYQEKIAALALNDLSDADRRELEAHLDICPQCRMEKERFAKTIQLLASAEDEPAPRHFFISPNAQPVFPRRLFSDMPFRLRAAYAGVFVPALLLIGAALSQFHISGDSKGWSMGFGRGNFDTAVIREEFLQAAAEDSQKNQRQLLEEIRSEIARLRTDEDRKTRELEDILVKLDSKIDGRVERSEEQIRQDTQIMIAVLYQELTRQWNQDMEAVKYRMNVAEIRDYLNTQKTEEILGAMLQIANMKF